MIKIHKHNEKEFAFLEELEKSIGKPIPIFKTSFRLDNIVWNQFAFFPSNGHIIQMGLYQQLVNKDIPESLESLKWLSVLHLGGNNLKNIPNQIESLTNLFSLSLDENDLEILPDWIGNLHISNLFISDNRLRTLPKSLCELETLKILNVTNNPLNELSDDLLKILYSRFRSGIKIIGLDAKFQEFERKERAIINAQRMESIKQAQEKREKEIMEKIREMMEVSTKINMNLMRTVLELDENTFAINIFKWAKLFKFKIDGDYVLIENGDVGGFLNYINNQTQVQNNSSKINVLESGIPQKNMTISDFRQVETTIQTRIELKSGNTITFQNHQYSILEKLGQGGMGAVYLARNQVNGNICAIKEFFTDKYYNSDKTKNNCEEYWDRERRIMELQSGSPVPSIKLLGSIKNDKSDPPQYFLLMDYVYGITLAKWIDKCRIEKESFNLKRIIREILIPLAKHLAFTHDHGIIHRDITPNNVMITEDKGILTPYLIDWGVAKELLVDRMFSPKKPYFTSTTTVATSITSVGNPPEVLYGLNPVAASDIYMFGYVCIFILKPGQIISPQKLLQSKIDLSDFLSGIPSSLVELIEQMLQFEPADRIANFGLIQAKLESLIKGVENINNAPMEAETEAENYETEQMILTAEQKNIDSLKHKPAEIIAAIESVKKQTSSTAPIFEQKSPAQPTSSQAIEQKAKDETPKKLERELNNASISEQANQKDLDDYEKLLIKANMEESKNPLNSLKILQHCLAILQKDYRAFLDKFPNRNQDVIMIERRIAYVEKRLKIKTDDFKEFEQAAKLAKVHQNQQKLQFLLVDLQMILFRAEKLKMVDTKKQYQPLFEETQKEFNQIVAQLKKFEFFYNSALKSKNYPDLLSVIKEMLYIAPKVGTEDDIEKYRKILLYIPAHEAK